MWLTSLPYSANMLNKLVRFWLNHTCLWLGPYNKKGSTLFISPKRRNSQNSVNVGGVLMRKFFEKKKKQQKPNAWLLGFGARPFPFWVALSTVVRCLSHTVDLMVSCNITLWVLLKAEWHWAWSLEVTLQAVMAIGLPVHASALFTPPFLPDSRRLQSCAAAWITSVLFSIFSSRALHLPCAAIACFSPCLLYSVYWWLCVGPRSDHLVVHRI